MNSIDTEARERLRSIEARMERVESMLEQALARIPNRRSAPLTGGGGGQAGELPRAQFIKRVVT